MRYEVLEQFFGQTVDISLTSRGTMTGILKPAETDSGWNDIVELEPESQRNKERYGSWILDKEMIAAIRLIKPHRDDEDDDGDDCCEKSS